MPDNETDTLATPANGTDKKDRIKPAVFYGSAIALVLFSLWSIIAPDAANNVIGTAVGWVSEYFGWYYFLTGTLVVIFVLVLAFSRYGRVKLGPDHATPDFSVFAWAAMLFAAGIGIDLMFFSVAEPVTQYMAPPQIEGQTVEAAREAIVWTLFHYGLTGWAMYTLMGIALAYFAFRHQLPLTIRSALFPIFGKRVQGRVGDAVDIAAVLGTTFGVAVSLGIGVVQLNYGLNFLFDLPQNTLMQVAIILVAVLMATASAVAGIDKGIRRLSELNVILAIGLMVYIMIVEGPIDLLNKLVLNVGDYVSMFPGMTLDTMAYDPNPEWMGLWTLFFWAWWIAWAPFVGLFLAKISRGRTIRQFVGAAMIIPFLFTLMFLAIFGNAAINQVRGGDEEFGETTMAVPEEGFYNLLAQYPGVTFIAGLATFVGLLFYVTSADSGAIVLGNFTTKLSDPRKDAKPWMRIFWSVVLGLLTIAMLLVDGITALQNATVIMGLPFSFVLYLIGFGLWKALRVESLRTEAKRASYHASVAERSTVDRGSSRTWRQRVSRTMSYPGKRQVIRYLETTARPAFESVANELEQQGVETLVTQTTLESTGLPYLELQVGMGTEQHFEYAIQPESAEVPGFAMGMVSETQEYWRLEVHLTEGNQGYDVMGYTSNQLISDMLDHYEHHLEFLRLSREAPGSNPLPDDVTFGDPDLPENSNH
ncbi:choline BCCT transporter BetT [Haloglycomyces albus]|uniref:choline BCCT transporter BetT n=1 Tax=Haloglycomyces albus TaxID=526067 RepID=UPI00046CD923|nr:choline BCCT transporter BetT [Haloglycomyces albus]